MGENNGNCDSSQRGWGNTRLLMVEIKLFQDKQFGLRAVRWGLDSLREEQHDQLESFDPWLPLMG